jgi:hypothetical protein
MENQIVKINPSEFGLTDETFEKFKKWSKNQINKI